MGKKLNKKQNSCPFLYFTLTCTFFHWCHRKLQTKEPSQHRCLSSPARAAYRATGASRASRTGSSQCCRGSSSWCRGHHWWCAAGGCPASGGRRPRWPSWTLSGEAERSNLRRMRRERRVSGNVTVVLILSALARTESSVMMSEKIKIRVSFFPVAGEDKTSLHTATQVEQTRARQHTDTHSQNSSPALYNLFILYAELNNS